jgi:predicted AlkP superfamily phosphohydrolase/phosphomutase
VVAGCDGRRARYNWPMSFNKLLVIGIDGAPHPLIEQWAAEGLLPGIAKLIQRGSFGVLNSTIPVHSPTAWASFITGLNPGRHGVFDFVRREPGSYRLGVVRADQFPGASIWRLLSEHGRRVGVINVPMTYPPEPVNGYLVSGLGTPDFANYTYPPELQAELDSSGYRVNKKFYFTRDRQDEWLDDIMSMTDKRGETAMRLLREKPWDFFMVVFRNSDEICHFFWHHMDKTHPQHNPEAPDRYKTAILDLYVKIDHWVGRLVESAGESVNVVVMSDHGAGPLYRDVFLNEWLWQRGWLALRSGVTDQKGWAHNAARLGLTRARISNALTRMNMHRLEVAIKRLLGDRIYVLPRDERPEFHNAIDWSRTQAYSFGYYGQIFINLKGREPEGIVEPEMYETLRDEIAQQLMTLVDPEDGQPVVDRVYKKEELFQGRYLADAPDLLMIMRGLTYITRMGYEFAGRRGELFREPYTDETGGHRLEGILIAAGPDIQQGHLSEQSILDVPPTLLQLMDCPIPGYMDSRPLSSIFTESFLTRQPPVFVETEIQTRREVEGSWGAAAEADVAERLKQLGYLG